MMDTTCQVRRQYGSTLQQLAQIADQLSRKHGQQKKDLESKFNQQLDALLTQVRTDWPSSASLNLALTVLCQEIGLTSERVANAIRAAWQQQVVQQQMQDALGDQSKRWRIIDLIGTCAKPAPDLGALPFGSSFLQFDFTLATPYISHDDEPNYLIGNPLTKDHVFGLPLIRPSSWKGNLRSALRLYKGWKDDVPEITRLFGNPKGAESDFRSGCLEFYPTFFYRIGLEIINPHDRKRKVGKNPILFECVPAGAQGAFSLLYVPFDRVGQDDNETRRQVAEDLFLIAEGLQAMFLTYGFSAKRTSGYGTARDEIVGAVRTRADERELTRLSQLAKEVKDVAF